VSEEKFVSRLAVALKTWLLPFRYGLERWSYTLQRISGVVVTIYFVLHIVETGNVVGGPEVWSVRPDAYMYAKRVWTDTIEFLANPLFDAGLVVIGFMVAFHTINGIRLFLAHMGYGLGRPSRPEPHEKPKSMSTAQRILFWASIVFAVFALVYTLDAFFEVLGHG